MSAIITTKGLALIARAKEKADQMFKAYSDIDEIFITSDLQGFTDKDRAENHTDYLADKRIFDFQRNSDFDEQSADSGEQTADSGQQSANSGEPKADNGEPSADSNEPATGDEPNTADNEERTALFTEYEQLFGQKPPHNIGTEKLRAKINEKKEALKVQS